MIHILEADSIQLEFGARRILSDIYFKCETGKVTGLLGRNGQGKSCLLQIVYGSLVAEKSVRFDGLSVPNAFKRPDLFAYLPQFNFIPKFLTIRRVFKDFNINFSAFEECFGEFSNQGNFRVGNLSGGERRLIELYIILKKQSEFIFLDEPFTHLNPIQIEKVKALISEEKEKKGILLTDHMFRHILDVSDNLYVLVNGKTHLIKEFSEVESLGYAYL